MIRVGIVQGPQGVPVPVDLDTGVPITFGGDGVTYEWEGSMALGGNKMALRCTIMAPLVTQTIESEAA